MRVDFSQGLVGLDGEVMIRPVIENGRPVIEENGEQKREPVVLRPICINALMADLAIDEKATGVEKLARWDFAQRVQNADGPLELTPKEVAELQDRIGAAFATVIVGPAFKILNGDGKAT